MKDLDFDELDRAVNSLMSDVPKASADSQPKQAETVVDLTAPAAKTSATPPVPSSPAPPVASSPAATPPSRPVPPTLPSRRGGRFMDVVHPSSDMKKPEQPKAASSRQGITIAPRATFNTTPAPAEETTPVKEKPEAVTPLPAAQPASAPEPTPAATSEWPDPLDMAGFVHEPDTKPAEPEPVIPSASEEPAPEVPKNEEVKTAENEPLSSPFLPDAKVEKRPLGGAAQPVEEPDHTPVITDNTPKTADDPNDQLPALPKDVQPPLPAELHSDLVAVEADTGTASNKPAEPLWQEPEEESKQPSGETLEKPQTAPREEDKPDERPAPGGPTSIPQQYREEPNSGDKENGAIYDTDTYHQPLTHPGKKKSGWLWVLWIVIILLVGAGGGAALYFSGLF